MNRQNGLNLSKFRVARHCRHANRFPNSVSKNLHFHIVGTLDYKLLENI